MADKTKLKGDAKRVADLIQDKADHKWRKKMATIFHGRLPRRGWGYRFVGVNA